MELYKRTLQRIAERDRLAAMAAQAAEEAAKERRAAEIDNSAKRYIHEAITGAAKMGQVQVQKTIEEVFEGAFAKQKVYLHPFDSKVFSNCN
jgi:TPP-dependent pyruvate/acetoin dehydrogenase alpha subunit